MVQSSIQEKESVWRVDPSLMWQWIDPDKIQLRLPNGQRITITESANEVLQVVEKLLSPLSFSELENWSQEQGLDQEVFHSIFSTLTEYSILASVNPLQDQHEKGAFFNLLAFEEKISSSLRSGLPYPYFDHAILEGTGVLFDSVQNLLTEFKDQIFIKSETQLPLHLFCCDENSYEPLRNANKQATTNKYPLLFLRWSGESLIVGPLYLPGEGPCFECLVVRQRASAHFLEELDAQIDGRLSQAQTPKRDFLLDDAVRYIVGRYLSMVVRGLFHLISPGQVETWDLVKGQRSVAEVLKVPRCECCGRVKSTDPLKAVGS